MSRIAVFSYKNGSGKTAASHLLAEGLVLAGAEVTMVSTANHVSRCLSHVRHKVIQSPDDEVLNQIISRDMKPHEILILDPHPSRFGEQGERFAEIADVTVVPFMLDQQSVEGMMHALDKFNNAVALPMCWSKPKNRHSQIALQIENRLLKVINKYQRRVLAPIPNTYSVNEVFDLVMPKNLLPYCIALAGSVLAAAPEICEKLSSASERRNIGLAA